MKKVREGYKMTELGEIPEKWSFKSIGELCNVTKLAGFEFTEYIEYKDDGEIIALRALNLKKGKLDLSHIKRIDKEVSEKLVRSKLNKDDIVFSYVGTIGEVAIIPESGKYHLAPNVAKISIDKDTIPEYFVHYLVSSYAGIEIKKLITTTSQPALSMGNIRQINVVLPSLKEQQKISLILSSVDEKIENTDKLIEKTKELKKGLMQRLLTKGMGHDRFKDTEIGRIPEAWIIRRLIDISQGKGEYGIGAVATEYIIGNPRYLRITDIGDESRLLFKDIKGFEDYNYEKYILKQNDIVFARTGNTTGKSYVYNEKDGELVFAGFLIKFTVNPKIVNVNFIKYIIQSLRYWDWVNVMSTRSGQPGINSNEYAGFLVPIPGIKEQDEIASIIASTDEKIQRYEFKKEKLQELKKGLMQKLLTGKIRVH